jgi:hypothetical protein
MKQARKKHGAGFKAKVALAANQRRPDCRRAGECVRGSPEPDLRVEKSSGWGF